MATGFVAGELHRHRSPLPVHGRDLPWQGAHRALVTEAVTVLVRPLAAGVVAVQARPPRAAHDEDIARAPAARASAGDEGVFHVEAHARRCTPGVCRGSAGLTAAAEGGASRCPV